MLRQKKFACFLGARLLGATAAQMQGVAIGWQVYSLTGNVMDLGWIGLAQFAPFLALILIAGHVADVVDRRKIITVGYLVNACCAAFLLGFTLSGWHAVWPVFAALALFGSARAFMMPAGQAVLISLVPREDFGYAVAVASSTFHLAIILGPMLGGVLYLVSPKLVYALVTVALIASALLMRGTRDKAVEGAPGQDAEACPPISAPARPAPTWDTVLEGLRFVRSQPVVLGAISLDLFAVLFGGATALLPAVARDVLHANSTALGALRSATAVGAACTAVLLAWRPLTRRVGWWMFGGVAVFGAGTIAFGMSHSLVLSLLALFAMGSGDMVSVYIRQILVQHATPDDIRGRVSAVSAVFIGASNELGEFESGLTARWWGVVPAIVVGGLATLAVTALWSAGFRDLRTADGFPRAQDAS